MEVKNSYVKSNGFSYPIRNIAFEDKLILGKLLTQSTHKGIDMKDSFSISPAGVVIYESPIDKSRAFRIYRDFQDNLTGAFEDAELISNLQQKQAHIKLTEFPTGVITLKNKIIGQEIIYYYGYVTLQNYIMNNYNFDNEIYLKILRIIRELINNEILYSDIHKQNLLIHPETKDIKLIDFDSSLISFWASKFRYETMMDSLIKLTNYIILNSNFSIETSGITTFESLEETYQKVYQR